MESLSLYRIGSHTLAYGLDSKFLAGGQSVLFVSPLSILTSCECHGTSFRSGEKTCHLDRSITGPPSRILTANCETVMNQKKGISP